MYASVTLSKAKKYHWFNEKSLALKNSRIVRGEVFRMDYCGKIHESIKDPYVKGDPIIRERKPLYIIKIGESYRKDGKTRSKQKHICTFDEWDVVDEMLRAEERGDKYQSFKFRDGGDYYDSVKRGFPEADPDLVRDIIGEKLIPIENRILDEFRKTKEYRSWKRTNKLKHKVKEEIKAKKEKEKREEAEREQKTRTEYERIFSNYQKPTSGISLSKEEIRVIDSCYRAMAVQLHPDKGGSLEDMVILNGLKEKIRKIM